MLNQPFVFRYTLLKCKIRHRLKSAAAELFYMLFLISIPFLTQAQNQHTIDSLEAKLKMAKEDSNKVNIYLALIKGHVYFKNNEGYKYEAPALALAEKLQLQKHIYRIKTSVGRLYWKKGEYDTALIKHNEALQLAKKVDDKNEMANILIYIGQDYIDQNKLNEGLKYLNKALEIALAIDNKTMVSRLYDLYSFVYNLEGNLPMSIQYRYKELEMEEQLGNEVDKAIILFNISYYKESIGDDSIAEVLRNTALLILEKSNLENAKAFMYDYYFEKYLEEKNISGAINNLNSLLASGITDKPRIGSAYSYVAQTYKALSNDTMALKYYLLSYDNVKETSSAYVALLYLDIGSCYTRMHEYKKAKEYFQKADTLTKTLDINSIRTNYWGSVEQLDSALGDWKSAYLNFKTYIRNKEILNSEENKAKANRIAMQYDFDKKEAAAKAEQEKKDIRQRNLRNSIIIGLAGALIFGGVVLRQRNRISKARKRSDELLLNILPEEVAEELKSKGSADPKQFNEVTVMFTDFKGFTHITEELSPTQLVNEIHTCFKAFDDIITRHNIEKIKTIGDSYMCAGGLPIVNKTNAIDVVRAALEIQAFMEARNEERKRNGLPAFEIRIGVNTGSVVAGIVGVKKFAYDIWGDTVNIASRMESSGEAGKVNISGNTYELVKDKFNCRYRGKIQAKNKGEIDMYFVETITS